MFPVTFRMMVAILLRELAEAVAGVVQCLAARAGLRRRGAR
jgi:hypothetical protein